MSLRLARMSQKRFFVFSLPSRLLRLTPSLRILSISRFLRAASFADSLAMMSAAPSISAASSVSSVPDQSPPDCARTAALAVLRESDPVTKATATRALYAAVLAGSAACSVDLELDEQLRRREAELSDVAAVLAADLEEGLGDLAE